MRIPRSLMIKGERWSIRHKNNVEDDEHNKCYGICNFEDRVIYLEKGMSKELEAETFIHEVFHAVLYEMHMNLDREIEEQVIDGLSYAVVNMFDVNIKTNRKK
jgi:hypothetical protein